MAADGRAVVQLSGELDMATAPEFVERAEPLVGTWPTIVLDLSRLTFCDSSGLHAFIELRRRCEHAGHRLVLRAPTPAVRRVLELACADQRLTIEA
ncbi:MAG: STAS domain-containing protein [Actinobacteria bacterium]|nr:STAS domain-containing protein [Actinomycetota bacterium]